MVVPNQLSEVVAPCDLEGGYLMDIELNGEVRTIVVVRILAMTRHARVAVNGAPPDLFYQSPVLLSTPTLAPYLTSHPRTLFVIPRLYSKPDEGVQQGETFVAIVLPPASPVPLPESPVRTSTTTPKSVNSTIPTGAWRDGICDFFNNCTVCCMSWCCGSGKFCHYLC